jgi:hypothetical protein
MDVPLADKISDMVRAVVKDAENILRNIPKKFLA